MLVMDLGVVKELLCQGHLDAAGLATWRNRVENRLEAETRLLAYGEEQAIMLPGGMQWQSG